MWRVIAGLLFLTACEVPNPSYDEDATVDGEPRDGSTSGAEAGSKGQGGTGGMGGAAGASIAFGGNTAMLVADASTSLDGPSSMAGMGGAGVGGMGSVPDARVMAVMDAPVAVAPGLVLQLALTQPSGTTAADSSRYNNSAGLYCLQPCGNGLPIWLLRDGRRGVEVAYYEFLEVAASKSLNSVTDDFSLFVWADQIGQPGVRSLASRLADNNALAFHLFFYYGRLSATVGATTVNDPSMAPVSQWVHVGLRRKAGVVSLFRDGVVVASAATAPMPSATTSVIVGAAALRTGNDTFADSILSDLVLYNRALSDAEVTSLSKGTVPP